MMVPLNGGFAKSSFFLCFQVKSELKEDSFSHQFHLNFTMSLGILRKICFGCQASQKRRGDKEDLTFESPCSRLRLPHLPGKSWLQFAWRYEMRCMCIQNRLKKHQLKLLVSSLSPGDTPVWSYHRPMEHWGFSSLLIEREGGGREAS